MTKDVLVLSAVRSAVGTFNGSLASLEPADLAGRVMKEAIAKAGFSVVSFERLTMGICTLYTATK